MPSPNHNGTNAAALQELKNKLYNETAATNARIAVRELSLAFNRETHEQLITNHPAASKLHLLADNEDDG